MNSSERVTSRLRGEPVDRPPNFNILMTFAAGYIHQPLARYYLDYRVLTAANLAVQADFELDLVQAISDPYREAADFGLQVEFPADGLPLARIPLLVEPADLLELPTPDPNSGRRMSDRLEAIRLFREKVGGTLPIMGWVEGALAEAADLRTVSTLLIDLFERPQWVLDLLEKCVQVAIAFARAQVKAGADLIGVGDSICSQISPKMYRQFALPYQQRIIDAIHAMGALARLHICGNTTHILSDMALSGADIIDLEWMVDFQQAAQVYQSGPAPCGNFDPVAVMLQGTPDQVRQAVLSCLEVGGARSFSAASCEIPAATPPENLLAHAQALREYGASPTAPTTSH